jgi:cell fate (sporulation/competence/biofilm development) regulator YlbF (YheA/YmcA/DUF963 family)
MKTGLTATPTGLTDPHHVIINNEEEYKPMTTEDIIKMAFELGNAIAQSEEIDNLKLMQSKLSEDADAYSLIMRYQEAQSQMENKLQEDLNVTPAEENQIEVMEQEINSNPMIQELIQVQEKFDNLMQGVYFALNQAISGDDGCSSGCDSCGGGCNVM